MKDKFFSKPFTKKKKWIMILTPVCSLLLAGALVTTAILIRNPVGDNSVDKPGIDRPDGDAQKPSDDNTSTGGEKPSDSVDPEKKGEKEENKKDDVQAPVSGEVVLFADPVGKMDLKNGFGFYYNSTLNTYYCHRGVDVSASAGEEVYATMDGKITAISTGDLLEGNSVSLDDGNGLVAVYYYIDPLQTLKVGDSVKRGDVIGNVSSPTGNEYKDGAHVHLEVFSNGTLTDPENYFAAMEK